MQATTVLGLMLYDAKTLPAMTPLATIQARYPNDTIQLITIDLKQACIDVIERTAPYHF